MELCIAGILVCIIPLIVLGFLGSIFGTCIGIIMRKGK
jgi:hypothetical protein